MRGLLRVLPVLAAGCAFDSRGIEGSTDGGGAVDARAADASVAYTVTVTTGGSGGGAVTSQPAGVMCGATCSASFDSGTIVLLTAIGDAASQFTGWNGGCTGVAPCTLLMDDDKTLTANFEPIGAFKWDARIGGAASDMANAVATSPSGRVVVAGYVDGVVDFGDGMMSMGATGTDPFVAQYLADGTLDWKRRVGAAGDDSAEDVAVDANGDVFVVGFYFGTINFGDGPLTNAGSADAFVAKLSGVDGSTLWSRRFGAGSNDLALGVTTDTAGNAYVVGEFQGTVDLGDGTMHTTAGSFDAVVAKYTPDGVITWSRRMGGTAADLANAVVVSDAGAVVVVGSFSGTTNLGGGAHTSAGMRDFFIVQLDALGDFVWDHAYGGGGDDVAEDVAIDGGDPVVVGAYSGTINVGGAPLSLADSSDWFVARYDATGAHVWSRGFGASGVDIARGVTIGGGNTILVAGGIRSLTDFGIGSPVSPMAEDAFLARYSAAGDYLWATRLGGASDEEAAGVAVDGSGDAFVAGTLKGAANFGGGNMTPLGPVDGFIVGLDQ